MKVYHHILKSEPRYFQPVWVGDKSFEIRKDDRGFQERDEVTLREYDAETDYYSGREITGTIKYLTDFAQLNGFVVFSLEINSRCED